MTTPEGTIKLRIDMMLNDYQRIGVVLWWFKPVQYGMGKRALDYICCIAGRFVAIEAKRDGAALRPLQRQTAREIHEAGGKVFIISRTDGLQAFARWLGEQRGNQVDGRTEATAVQKDESVPSGTLT